MFRISFTFGLLSSFLFFPFPFSFLLLVFFLMMVLADGKRLGRERAEVIKCRN